MWWLSPGTEDLLSPLAGPPPSALLSIQQPAPLSSISGLNASAAAAAPLPPPANRVRTKEETDAAHDLLELSRSLPPLPGPQTTSLHPAHPPTPPTPRLTQFELPHDQEEMEELDECRYDLFYSDIVTLK